ncbi:hypothetical protein D3C76_1095010 [compost metagenome]
MRVWSAIIRWRFSSSVAGLGSSDEQALSSRAEAMAVLINRFEFFGMFNPLCSSYRFCSNTSIAPAVGAQALGGVAQLRTESSGRALLLTRLLMLLRLRRATGQFRWINGEQRRIAEQAVGT